MAEVDLSLTCLTQHGPRRCSPQDAIGSTRGLWDDSGDRLGKYDYTPFGGKLAESGVDITRKFTDHDWDSEARLYYTAYRYYSPDSNRWLTRDPLGMVDGPNVYAYVVNNPVSRWDALGQCGGGASIADTVSDWVLSGVFLTLCLYTLYKLAKVIRAAAKAMGRQNSVGASLENCGICILAAVASYVAMNLDPSTGLGELVGRTLAFTCGAFCVASFLSIEVLTNTLWATQSFVYSLVPGLAGHALAGGLAGWSCFSFIKKVIEL